MKRSKRRKLKRLKKKSKRKNKMRILTEEEFGMLIPHKMRYKVNQEIHPGEIYWVTQEIVTDKSDFEIVQEAIKGTNIKKFYITARDLSSNYEFDEDLENEVLAVVTPDEIEAEDYFKALKEHGCLDKGYVSEHDRIVELANAIERDCKGDKIEIRVECPFPRG